MYAVFIIMISADCSINFSILFLLNLFKDLIVLVIFLMGHLIFSLQHLYFLVIGFCPLEITGLEEEMEVFQHL